MAEVRATKTDGEDLIRGKDVLIYLNYGETATEAAPKWTVIGGQKTADFTVSADSIDATTKNDNGWGRNYGGIKSTELKVEGIVAVKDSAYDALYDAYKKGESVDICRFWATKKYAERNWYQITEMSDTTAHDDMASFSMTLQGIGEPKTYTNVATIDAVRTGA